MYIYVGLYTYSCIRDHVDVLTQSSMYSFILTDVVMYV